MSRRPIPSIWSNVITPTVRVPRYGIIDWASEAVRHCNGMQVIDFTEITWIEVVFLYGKCSTFVTVAQENRFSHLNELEVWIFEKSPERINATSATNLNEIAANVAWSVHRFLRNCMSPIAKSFRLQTEPTHVQTINNRICKVINANYHSSTLKNVIQCLFRISFLGLKNKKFIFFTISWSDFSSNNNLLKTGLSSMRRASSHQRKRNRTYNRYRLLPGSRPQGSTRQYYRYGRLNSYRQPGSTNSNAVASNTDNSTTPESCVTIFHYRPSCNSLSLLMCHLPKTNWLIYASVSFEFAGRLEIMNENQNAMQSNCERERHLFTLTDVELWATCARTY